MTDSLPISDNDSEDERLIKEIEAEDDCSILKNYHELLLKHIKLQDKIIKYQNLLLFSIKSREMLIKENAILKNTIQQIEDLFNIENNIEE